METFMERLEKILKEKGITQAELAEKVHIRRPTISEWKKNGGSPSLEVASVMAVYIGVSLEWLATGKEAESIAPQYQSFLNDVMALPEYDFEELKAIVKIKKDRLQKVTV